MVSSSLVDLLDSELTVRMLFEFNFERMMFVSEI